MNKPLSERKLVVILFIMVLIIFSFAQRDTPKLELLYTHHKTTDNKLAMKTGKYSIMLPADTRND